MICTHAKELAALGDWVDYKWGFILGLYECPPSECTDQNVARKLHHSLEGLDLRTEHFLQISGDLDLDCIPFGGLGDCGPWTGLPVHSSYLRLCHNDMRAILT